MNAAHKLEVFEIELARQERDAALNKVKSIAAQIAAPTDTIATAVAILQGHEALLLRAKEAEEQAEQVEALKRNLNTSMNNSAELRGLADKYKGECEQLLAKHNLSVEQANAEITQLQSLLRIKTAEVKAFQALNPVKLQALNKRLQEKNRELTSLNEALNKQIGPLRKQNKEAVKIAALNEKLFADNRNLNNALDKACLDINQQNATPPILEIGEEWALYATVEKPDQIIIVDKRTDAARIYHRTEGLWKLRPVPKAVIGHADEIFQKCIEWEKEAIDYGEGVFAK